MRPRKRLCAGPGRCAVAWVLTLAEVTKLAVTNASSPRLLATLVISCARLPGRRPSQFSRESRTKPATPTSCTCPASLGNSPALNSPSATDK